MTNTGYVLSKEDARTVLREAREAKQAAFRAVRELEKIRYQFGYAQNVNPIEFFKPKTTLEPGGTCTAILQIWNRSSSAYTSSNRYNEETITDAHGWAFAVGSDDYSSTTHILPVVRSQFSGQLEVIAPCNLIQRAKPDANVTAGNTGTFSVYADETDTTVNVTAEVKWGDNAEDVTSGKESWVRYNIEAAKWEYIGGDCE